MTFQCFSISYFQSYSSQEEKDKWLEDLNFAISIANSDQIELAEMPLPTINTLNNGLGDGEDSEPPASPDKSQTQHRYTV